MWSRIRVGHEDEEQHDDDPDALAELHDDEDEHDAQRQDPGEAVDDELVPPSLLAQAEVVLGHAEASHREAGEHADGVHADEDVQLGIGSDEERLGGDGEDDDPVREHEPVAAAGELAGQEGVLGDEAREVREAVEARVAAGPEDEHRRRLHEVEAEPAVPGRAEDVLSPPGRAPSGCRQVGNGVGDVGEERDAGARASRG